MPIDFEHYRRTSEKKPLPRYGPRIPDEVVSEIMQRIFDGAGVREMAREYGIPKSTISRWVNGIDRTNESLYDKYINTIR